MKNVENIVSIKKHFYSFIQQMFIKHLSYAR